MNQSPTDFRKLLHNAAFAVLPDRTFLRVSGSDATRWLNGMVTNSIPALSPGEGNYSFLLNAQGRIQGDCLVFREPGEAGGVQFLLATDAAQVERIRTHLDHFIIMDDVELTPALEDESSLLLLGPETPELLRRLRLPELPPLRLAHADSLHGSVLLLTPPPGLVPRWEVRAPAATIQAVKAYLVGEGVFEALPNLLEQLRVLEGAPRFGVDIRDRELPQETNQAHALHFAKGCYLGQEIVERIRSRGQVHRVFSAFRLEGALPSLPSALEAAGKPVGELTSALEVPLAENPALLALGYIRREALQQHTALTYDGGVAHPRSLG